MLGIKYRVTGMLGKDSTTSSTQNWRPRGSLWRPHWPWTHRLAVAGFRQTLFYLSLLTQRRMEYATLSEWRELTAYLTNNKYTRWWKYRLHWLNYHTVYTCPEMPSSTSSIHKMMDQFLRNEDETKLTSNQIILVDKTWVFTRLLTD